VRLRPQNGFRKPASPPNGLGSAAGWVGLCLWLSTVGWLAGPSFAQTREPLAVVAGEAIYEEDLLPLIQGPMQQIRRQEYELKSQALENLLNQKLLDPAISMIPGRAAGTIAVEGLTTLPGAAGGQDVDASEAVKAALTWEQEVTSQIGRLMDLAASENDHLAQNFLRWFVDEQLEEVKKMDQLASVIRRAGEKNLLMVEAYLAHLDTGE